MEWLNPALTCAPGDSVKLRSATQMHTVFRLKFAFYCSFSLCLFFSSLCAFVRRIPFISSPEPEALLWSYISSLTIYV